MQTSTSLSLTTGTYTLKIKGSGFKTWEQRNLVLNPSDVRGVDITMEVGQMSETVTVTATAYQIQTERRKKTQSRQSRLTIFRSSAATNHNNINGMRGDPSLITIDGAIGMDVTQNNGT